MLSDSVSAACTGTRGHDVSVTNDWERMSMAVLSAILVDTESGVLSAGADPRRDTYAIGR